MSSTSTRNNYTRPKIIIKCGFCILRNLNFVLWKRAIPISISSIYKYRLSTSIKSNDIIHITITYNTLFLHRWTTNTSVIPGHIYVTYDTSDTDRLLHLNNVSSLGSPCHNIYISFSNPTSAGIYHYRRRDIKLYLTFFQHSVTTTPNVILLLRTRRNNNYITIYFPKHYNPSPKLYYTETL